MSTQDPTRTRGGADRLGSATAGRAMPRVTRKSTETKSALKTTELMAYIAASAAVLIAAMVVDESNAGGFGARQAWLYFTILTVGYMVSRGFAKSGSRDPYDDDSDR